MKFILLECYRTIRKAKLYFILSVITTGIGVFLIQASYVSQLAVKRAQKEVSNNLTVQLYLKDIPETEKYQLTEEKLKQISFVKSYKFISKAEAEDVFLKETGEDFRKVLDYNPLPAVYSVELSETLLEGGKLDEALKQLRTVPLVTEAGFAMDLYNQFISISQEVKKYLYTITVILVAMALYIATSFSITQLDIRAEEIKTMRLVGGSRLMIASPIFINSALVGLLGALLSGLAWYFILANARSILGLFGDILIELRLAINLSALSGLAIGGVSGLIGLIRLKVKK